MPGEIAPRDLGANLRVQRAHRRERTEIEVLAEHERPRDRGQRLRQLAAIGAARNKNAGVATCGHNARLDPGVALPFAPLGDKVVLQRIEAARQRSGIAVGTQAHVDAEYLAVLGDVGERVDQPASEAGEIFVIGQQPRSCAGS